jgi:DNA-binding XRE family transcriptional regulator
MQIKIRNIDNFNALVIRKGFSKRKFAITAGISQPMFVQISNGKRYPSPATAKLILSVLGLQFDDVFKIVHTTSASETEIGDLRRIQLA